MKNKIKKSIVVLGVTLTVLSSSMSVFAASCLNVRDYGCHNYSHQYVRTEVTQVLEGYSRGKYHFTVTVTERGKCVCGEEGTIDSYSFDRYSTIR